MPRVSIYGSGVEDRDLRREDEWWAPAYDPSGWSAPRIVAPVGGYPWLELHERITPLLVERELPLELVEVRTGTLDANVEPHVALRAAWQAGTRCRRGFRRGEACAAAPNTEVRACAGAGGPCGDRLAV